MKNENNIHIENLLNKFFEGLTSNDEEKELYAFFSHPDIPEYLEKYRPAFTYFEKGIVNDVKNKKTYKTKSTRKRKLVLFSGIAATLLILSLTFFVLNGGKEELNKYEVCYVIRNGVRITDPDIVKAEVEKTLRDIEEQKKIIEELMLEIEMNEIELKLKALELLEENENMINIVDDTVFEVDDSEKNINKKLL